MFVILGKYVFLCNLWILSNSFEEEWNFEKQYLYLIYNLLPVT